MLCFIINTETFRGLKSSFEDMIWLPKLLDIAISKMEFFVGEEMQWNIYLPLCLSLSLPLSLSMSLYVSVSLSLCFCDSILNISIISHKLFGFSCHQEITDI